MTTVIGILGGIGSGKSTVSQALAARGAVVLDADALAHRAYEDEAVRRELVAAFGASVITEDGGVSREELAARIFGPDGEANRRRLEGLVHPWVRARIREGLAAAREDRKPVVVLDVPLLLGSPFMDDCDHVLFVRSKRETRLKRTAARGWDAKELEARELAQPSLEEKEAIADLTVDNDGDLKSLEEQVDRIWKTLLTEGSEN